jgi:uncharacterized protein
MKQCTLALRTTPSSVPTMAQCLAEFLTSGVPENPGIGKVDPPKKPKDSADVVQAELKVEAAADGNRKFALTLTVAAPWHLYANPTGPESLADSQTDVSVYVGGKKVEATVVYPKGKEVIDKDVGKYLIYEGEVKITGIFPAAEGDVEARVKVNACKDGTCLLEGILKVK